MENANNSKKQESFADLLEESFAKNLKIEGSVVKGKVVSIENDIALVDVGLKSEGRISMKEFSSYGAKSEIQAGDLVDALSSEGPFTVFAPTNDAFNNLPDGTLESLLLPENIGTLQSILTYHVVAGKFMAKDVVNAINENGGQLTVTTLQGNDLTLKMWEGNVYVKDATGNKAKVIITDVETTNGVIHAINNVVLPE